MRRGSTIVGYLVALVATALAVVVWLLLYPFLGASAPLLVFVPAVIFATRHGGLGPGLLATTFSALATLVLLDPASGLGLPEPPEMTRVGLFVLVGLLSMWLMEALHTTTRDSLLARQEAEERFRLLVEGVQDYALFLMDPAGRVASWNPGVERLLGYSEREIVGQPFSRIFTPEDVAAGAHERELRDAREAGAASDDRWHVRKDGSRFFASGVVRPLRGPRGEPRGYAKVLQDVTHRQRLEHVLRGRAAALASMLKALTPEPDLGAFLGRVVATVAEQLQSPAVSLWLCDEARDEWAPRVSFEDGRVLTEGRPGCSTTDADLRPDEMPAWGEMLRTCRSVILADVAGNPHIRNREWLLRRGVQAMLLVPLLLETRAVGALVVCHTTKREYHPGEIELGEALAQQATLAVRLTELADRGRQAAVLEERNRMAREIHDTLAQGFTGVVIHLESAEDALAEGAAEAVRSHLVRARDLARAGLAEARQSVHALRPHALEHSGLPEALTRSIEKMTADTHAPRAEFHVHGRPRPLPPEIEDHLFRIGVEALTNALKHADASVVRMALFFEPEQVRLSVQDNGRGFDPSSLPQGEGFGLTGMHERAGQIGGRLSVSSRAGQGTEVVAIAPSARPATPVRSAREKNPHGRGQ